MRKKRKPEAPHSTWWQDHKRGLAALCKQFSIPPPTNEEQLKMFGRFTQIFAHRVDLGHWPNRGDIAQKCYRCAGMVSPDEEKTARQSVDVASFLHPEETFFGSDGQRRTAEETVKFLDPPPDIERSGGSLERLHAELAELTHRLSVVTKKIAAASLALE